MPITPRSTPAFGSGTADADAPDFDRALGLAAPVEGWMSDDQARRLWAAAARLPAGATVVEIGSYRGRSMIMLGTAAPPDAHLVAIDPHAGNDRGPREWVGTDVEGEADNAAFRANLETAGLSGRVRHVRKFSDQALGDVTGEIDLLYVDGAHSYQPALADIVRWGARVPVGGTLLIHDSFSSVGVTLALLRALFISGDFQYVGRSRSLAEYRRVGAGQVRRIENAARQAAQLPWFARNLVIKTLIVAKLQPAARALNHGSDDWPY